MIGCIIQARMGSTRLPGKVLKKINGEVPMLKFQLDQLKHSKRIEKIVVATTNMEEDDEIVNFCKANDVECFRGESENVLDRYYQCAKKFNFSIILRMTGDNPLIDPEIVDEIIGKFVDSDYNYMTNEHPKTYPLGFAVEVFDFQSIEEAWRHAELPSECEHVTPYLIKNKDRFKHYNHAYEKENLSYIRCTVDTEYDFKLIEKVISKIALKPIKLNHVLELFLEKPDLLEINKHVKHDGYERSLLEDKEFLKDKENIK